MTVRKLPTGLQRFTLSLALFASSVASAHVVSAYHDEAGFSRLKPPARGRGWGEAGAALEPIALALPLRDRVLPGEGNGG
jgi:hypothetical protein